MASDQEARSAASPSRPRIDWMTLPELSEAIPPAYTEFIGEQLIAHISQEVAA